MYFAAIPAESMVFASHAEPAGRRSVERDRSGALHPLEMLFCRLPLETSGGIGSPITLVGIR